MKTATVRQIRNAFPSVLRYIRNGENVAITSRKKVVATLTPPVGTKLVRKGKYWAGCDTRFANVLKQPKLARTGTELLAEERERF